jgi:hypothetical protein
VAGASQGFGVGRPLGVGSCILQKSGVEKEGRRGIGLRGFDASQIGEDWIVVEEGKKGVVVGELRSVEEKGEERERTKILQGWRIPGGKENSWFVLSKQC